MNPQKQIKLLLVLPFFYPHRGGSQKYAEELYANMQKNHNDIAVDVLCYNTDNASNYENYRGFKIYRVSCWNVIPARFALPNPISLLSILIKLSKNKYDYVNTHIRFFDPTWWLWIYAKLIKAKSIYTGHVVGHPVYQKRSVELIAKIIDLTIAKFSLKFYDYITFTNKAAQQFFKETLGVKKETYLIYGGVDTIFFSPKDKNSQRSIPKINLNVDKNTVLVTFVGRLIWTKGVTYLYDAIKLIHNSGKDNNVIFVLAGPGELEMIMKNKIAEDNLENKVILTGNLKYEEVKELLSISNIFINPSNHNEGFPNTVLEAGSSECFVIATDNAGTKEVIKNYETGILVPQKNPRSFADTILWVLNNPEKREEIAKNFRKMLVKDFDWNIISEQLYILLKK